MGYVIKLEGVAGVVENGWPNFKNKIPDCYLKFYNPDAFGGRGDSEWTAKKEEALVFATNLEALETWRKTSTVMPIRPDGEPNRPLTAYDISVVKV